MSQVLKAAQSRVWIIEGGASPANAPSYLGRARADSIDYSLGSITPVRQPSPARYGQFEVIDTIRGAPDLPTVSIEQYMQDIVSTLLEIANRQCPVDLQIHFGICERPDDFRGWTIARILEDAQPQTFSTTPLGALDPADNAAILETLNLAGTRLYDVKQLRPEEKASSQVTDPVVDVVICDSATCGECGLPSNGCQVVFALGGATTGSPGLQAELNYTSNGGATWGTTEITTLGLGDQPNAMACVGTNLVVVSEDTESLHYAPIADILNGDEVWTEVTTGFVSGGGPRCIVALGSNKVWIAGAGGYIYFSGNIESGVSVQHAGVLTTQNLNSIAAADENNIVVVGAANAVLSSASGGTTWSLLTGPTAGVVLNTVAMKNASQFLIGTAGGELWYTVDAGNNWAESAFTGSGSGQVRDVAFASKNVGYMAHDTATPAGRIFRTIDGGNSWYILPDEQGQLIPANDQVTALAVCEEDVNLVWGGGVAANGTDGFLVVFA
jgi:hypothetical protein